MRSVSKRGQLQMGKQDYPSDYCSTSALARLFAIPGDQLFGGLENAQLISRQQNGWVVTEKGAAVGGRMGTLGGTSSFPVWPKRLAVDRDFWATVGFDGDPSVEVAQWIAQRGFYLADCELSAAELGSELVAHFSASLFEDPAIAERMLKEHLSNALLKFARLNCFQLARSCPVIPELESAPDSVVYVQQALLRQGRVVSAILMESGNRRRSIERLNRQVACGIPSIWIKCGSAPKWFPDPGTVVVWVTDVGAKLLSHDGEERRATPSDARDARLRAPGVQRLEPALQSVHEKVPSTVRILELLADGMNPLTGAKLPPESPYSDPRVIRALFHAIRIMEVTPDAKALPTKSFAATGAKRLPRNAAKGWTKEEDELLMREFLASEPIAVLAKKHGRTHGGISSRLRKLGLIL